MNTNLRRLTSLLLTLLGLAFRVGPTAQSAVIPGLFNTGVDPSPTPLAPGDLDPHYALRTGSPIVGDPITVRASGGFPIPPWLADNGASAWITPAISTQGPGATDGSAIYRYQTVFDLTGLEPTTAVITGQWATDNYGTDILLNGASTGQTNAAQFGVWTPFRIDQGFVAGTNTLTFLVNNGYLEPTPDGPTGLRVELTGTASVAPPIPGLYNTGVDAGGALQADDATEVHYTLVGASPVKGIPFVATSAGGFPIGPWLGDHPDSAWITPSPTTVGPNAVPRGADYFYQTRFDLTGRDPLTAVIEGQWATDNQGMDVLINGRSTGQTNPSEFAAWTPFRIDQGLVWGINTLTFVVNNGAGETTADGPTGLRVELQGSALPSCVDFQSLLPMPVPASWDYRGIQFSAHGPSGAPLSPAGIRRDGAFTGLNCGWQLELTLPCPCDSVDLTLVHFAVPALAHAFDASGATVATALMRGPQQIAEKVGLKGSGITRVVIVAPSDETLLLGVCYRAEGENPLRITALTNAGGAVTLTWRSQAGKVYKVQFRPSLSAGSWVDLAGEVTATGSTATHVDATIGPAGQRFYRVLETPSAAAPGNAAVSGSPAHATVTWSPAAGASGYRVERWSQVNPDCCRASSPLLPATATSWADSDYPLAGRYLFRITALHPEGTYGVADVNWLRPTPQDPAGFTAVPAGGTTVRLSWQPVPGVTRYLVGGPGANMEVPVSGTTLSVAGVPVGTQTWTVFSLYEPGGVFTPGVQTSVVVPAPVVLSGWVDLHTHPMINLAFGGKLVHGGVDVGSLLPQDTSCRGPTRATDIAHALGDDRPSHGGWNAATFPCGDELRKLIIEAFQRENGAFPTAPQALGFPSFDMWPRWDDITHQKMWFEWIRRCRDGGLRVMVALATNNKTLADGVQGDHDALPTDDVGSGDLQIAEIKTFVARHSDFMEVALTPADIPRIAQANKIAIVLGVELDNLGNFNAINIGALPLATAERLIADEIQRLYDAGVRYIFPIHVVDNAFGGTAIYKAAFNTSNRREAGHYWSIECADAADEITYEYKESDDVLGNLRSALGFFVKLGLNPLEHPGPPPSCPPGVGHRNAQRLTPLGGLALKQMMKRGMIIDIDHMSHKTAEDALDVAEANGYPVVSGHSGIRSLGGSNAENSRTRRQLQRIGKLHGMFGLGSDGALAGQWSQLYQQAMFEMGYADPDPTQATYRNGAVAFGTDLNGLVKGPQPGGGNWITYDENFRMSFSGTKFWDYNVEGVAHYGMLPDFIRDVRANAAIPHLESGGDRRALTGPELVEDHLFRSADYFWHMWERIEARKLSLH